MNNILSFSFGVEAFGRLLSLRDIFCVCYTTFLCCLSVLFMAEAAVKLGISQEDDDIRDTCSDTDVGGVSTPRTSSKRTTVRDLEGKFLSLVQNVEKKFDSIMTFLQGFSGRQGNPVNFGQEDDVLSIQPRTSELKDLFGESPSHSIFQDNDHGSDKCKDSVDNTVSVKPYSQYTNVNNQQNEGLAAVFHVDKPGSQLDDIILEDSQKEYFT